MDGDVNGGTGEADSTDTGNGTSRRRRRRSSPASVSAVRDIDFMPKGKASLSDFVAREGARDPDGTESGRGVLP